MDTLEQKGRPDGERLDLGRLDSLVGFHLRMATAALYRDFAQAMEGTGLTQKLFAVLELIEANRDLPNPATYLFETDLDFPFNETILPVAKRKFLRGLYS